MSAPRGAALVARRALGPAVLLALVAGLLTACTSAGTESDAGSTATPISGDLPATTSPATTSPPPTSPPPTSPPATSTSPSPPSPSRMEPLALAFGIHRGAVDVSAQLARRIVTGAVTDWSALGEPAGRLTVRRGSQGLDAVERSAATLAIVPASSLRPTVQAASIDGVDPLRQPARYPLRVRTDAPAPVVTTVTYVGDIMLGRGVGAATPERPGAALQPLTERLARADLTVGNLESSLSDDGYPSQGTDSFAADPGVLGPLAAAGFDVLSLANNHTGDYGDKALLQTLRRIDASPIARVGAGRNGVEAWRPVVTEHGGVRFGFLAFNAIGETPRATPNGPGAAEIRMQPRTGPLDRGDLDRMTRQVSRLAQRVDVVTVLPHWGEQYTNVPFPDQRTVGAALVDAGADLVVGGHPHWVQGVQLRRGTLIAHSLGNFIFDMETTETREGVMLELTYWDEILMGAEFTPYVIGPDYAPRVIRGARADVILDRMWETSDPPLSR